MFVERRKPLDFSKYSFILANAQRLEQEIKDLRDTLDTLNEYRMNISPVLTGMPSGGSKKDKVPEFVIKLNHDRQNLNRRLDGLVALYGEAKDTLYRMEMAVNRISDVQLRDIARMYYFDGANVPRIAESVSLSRHSVYRRISEINKILPVQKAETRGS